MYLSWWVASVQAPTIDDGLAPLPPLPVVAPMSNDFADPVIEIIDNDDESDNGTDSDSLSDEEVNLADPCSNGSDYDSDSN